VGLLRNGVSGVGFEEILLGMTIYLNQDLRDFRIFRIEINNIVQKCEKKFGFFD
jgi:hypothetical protein